MFRDLGPNWYATVMGTGIVAVAAALLPVRVTGLHVFGAGGMGAGGLLPDRADRRLGGALDQVP